MSTSPAALELSGITQRFGAVTAVDDLSLSIPSGQIVAVLGPNGAGKTTMIDIALGLTSATSGRAALFGRAPREAVAQGRVGAMMQTGGLLRDLTVKETVQMVAALQKVPNRVGATLEEARLTDLAGRKVSRCSGGEQQRVKFALAVVAQPDLLFLDEPTTGMDVAARRDFWAAMQHQAQQGRTIVFATHYLEEAQAFAQRIVVLGKGRILADGTVDELRSITSGRRVSAVLPDGTRIAEHCADSDALARDLLSKGARDLLISEPSLDDVFVTLTEGSR